MRKRLLAVAVILLFTVVGVGEAFARMGGGRSFGSRGSRGMSSPYRSTRTTNPSRSAATGTPSQGGGLFRNMAAGMAGGMLGSMLFGGMSGCGSGADRQATDNSAVDASGKEASGGGMSFLDILLLAGLGYLAYSFFVKRRQRQQGQESPYFPTPLSPTAPGPSSAPFPRASEDAGEVDPRQGIEMIGRMDPSFDEKTFSEQASDLFFRLQGAWMRRDLGPVASLLTEEMRGVLQADVNGLKAAGQVNRLENIAVRSVEIAEAWQESGEDYVTVRFLANLLDYTTDESGRVLSGSDSTPVKFEEFWTLTRPVGPGAWKLSAIRQS